MAGRQSTMDHVWLAQVALPENAGAVPLPLAPAAGPEVAHHPQAICARPERVLHHQEREQLQAAQLTNRTLYALRKEPLARELLQNHWLVGRSAPCQSSRVAKLLSAPLPLQSQSCPYRFLGFSRTDCPAQPFLAFDGIPVAPTFIFTIVSPTAPAVQVRRGQTWRCLLRSCSHNPTQWGPRCIKFA